jgi:choloylglycine hydrolase
MNTSQRITASLKLVTLLVASSLLSASPTLACTSVQLTAADGSSVVARTMDDNPATMKIKVALTPRGKTIRSTNPDGSPGLTFVTKYSSFGLPMIGSTTPTDAMNEKGLTLSVQILNASYFPTSVPPGKKAQALSNFDSPLWLISQFDTVDEVKANLDKVAIWTREQMPFHLVLFDATGKGIVIEWVKDEASGNSVTKVYDNKVGVVTNDPTFDWQLTNLKNYVQTTPVSSHSKQFGDLTVTVPNMGNGSFGVPGDMTAPSRFVRMAVQRTSVKTPSNAAEALSLVSHIINNADVALGTVQDAASPASPYDVTIWTSLRDSKQGAYYLRTSEGFNFFKVDCTQLWDLQKIKELSLADLQKSGLSDVTTLLK